MGVCVPLDRCSTCAAFSCRISKPMDEQQKADILRAQKEHLNLVAQYRAVQSRLNHMSEESCTGQPGSSLGNGILKIDLDFCDQSKFKIPRNQTSSKSLDHLWRPQMSVACALVWGVLGSAFVLLTDIIKMRMQRILLHMPCAHASEVVECYYLYEADMVKNPGTEFSMLGMALDEAQSCLQGRRLPMPHHLIIEAGLIFLMRY